MASLLLQIIGDEEPKNFSSAELQAIVNEISVGNLTIAQVVGYVGLDANEETELTWLVGRISASTNKERTSIGIRTVLENAERRTPGYITSSDVQTKINAYVVT